MKINATSAVAVAAILLLSACGGGDGSSDSGSDSLAVGDCAAVVDPTSAAPDLQKVGCEEGSAEYSITAIGATADDLGACDFSIQLDQAYCLGEVGSTVDPVAEAESQLDYSTLEAGDCTDATVEQAEPTRVIPCDEPDATSEVLDIAEDPSDCEGNVAAQRDGVVVCMQTR
jgi:hypothetical protein